MKKMGGGGSRPDAGRQPPSFSSLWRERRQPADRGPPESAWNLAADGPGLPAETLRQGPDQGILGRQWSRRNAGTTDVEAPAEPVQGSEELGGVAAFAGGFGDGCGDRQVMSRAGVPPCRRFFSARGDAGVRQKRPWVANATQMQRPCQVSAGTPEWEEPPPITAGDISHRRHSGVSWASCPGQPFPEESVTRWQTQE